MSRRAHKRVKHRTNSSRFLGGSREGSKTKYPDQEPLTHDLRKGGLESVFQRAAAALIEEWEQPNFAVNIEPGASAFSSASMTLNGYLVDY